MSRRLDGHQAERACLAEFLDYQREALINKLGDLTEDQARMTPTASSLSLLSLVKHSAFWEREWFQVIVGGRSFPDGLPDVQPGDEDPTFRLDEHDTIASVIADYRQQIAGSREILATFDLDAPCAMPEMAHETVRWVAVHMIEETARHAGHADIIRESIDGTRGR